MKIVVIVPTYNEKENIVTLIRQILRLNLNINIIVVDDNSPDGTGELVEAVAAADERVEVIHRAGKLGLGTAYIAGFKAGIAAGANLLITMDADFSHNPSYIPDLVRLAESYHVSIGSRYIPQGGVVNWGWQRRWLSWGANQFARRLLGLRAKDCTAGFRCYRTEVLQSIEFGQIFSNGYSFLLEMLFKCQQRGFTVGETPIIFANREQGYSKISKQEIFKAMYTVLRLAQLRATPKQAQSTPTTKTVQAHKQA